MLGGYIDSRQREYLAPLRIVWMQGEIAEADNLLLNDDSVCRLSPGASVVLDFGRELHGGVRFDAPATSTGQVAAVRVRFGESVSEAMGSPNNDHAIHDWDTQIAWMGRTEIGETGFRFVRVDVTDESPILSLRQILAVFLYHPLEYLGSFTCSDPLLNQIWQVGAYTVHLCMQDHVWDGIKRDRLVWIGDLHPEARVIGAVFGKQEIVQQTLDYQRDRTPLPQWMNGISSYSLWWILIQQDWYLQWGDCSYLMTQKDYLIELLSLIAGKLDVQGKEHLDGGRFLEWPTSSDPTAIDAGLQALTVLALRAGAKLCAALGKTDAAAGAHAAADFAAGALLPVTYSKQANALLVLAGLADAEQVNKESLALDPHQGLSTFYGYYILQARALAGDYDGCLDLIRTYWGGMLTLGATTFWEGFELDWLENASRIDELTAPGQVDVHQSYGDWCYKGLRHSLCHGWAAGPTAWLMEHVLGINPVISGCREVEIQPHLGDLKWARGTFPTPSGMIEVTHEYDAQGILHSQIHLPDGVHQRTKG
jgi:alpha-L-rhamnosidase